MKILFLHISDMHIKNKDGINGFQIKKIEDSINQLGAFEQILLIISGDIAYSGHRIQYEHAWHAIAAKLVKAPARSCVSP